MFYWGTVCKNELKEEKGNSKFNGIFNLALKAVYSYSQWVWHEPQCKIALAMHKDSS